MTKRIMIRILSISMVFAVVFSTTAFPVEARDFAQEIKDLENKIDKVNDNINSSSESIDELQAQIATMQKQLDVYNEKILALNKDISEKDTLIQQKESEISALTAEIDNTNKKIEEQNITINKTYDILKDRLRASYMAGETSTLEILLNSKDFESFLTRMELVSKVSKHDTGLVKDIEVQITELKKMNDSLAANKTDLEGKKTQIETEKSAIVSARAEVQSTYDALNKKQSAVEANVQKQNSIIASLNKDDARYKKAMDEVRKAEEEYAKNTSGGGSTGDGTILPGGDGSHGFKVSSKGMISPLQGNITVSSPYGWRTLYGERDFHLGIDLTVAGGTAGKPIYAAADGTVKLAEYNASYGFTILIDHGNGVKTRYAHAQENSFRVSVGQKVSQGQVIALAGNTGNSYGAHLHFEVIINGSPNKYNTVDPRPYLPF